MLKRTILFSKKTPWTRIYSTKAAATLANYLQGRGYFDAEVDLQKRSYNTAGRLTSSTRLMPGARHKLVKVEIAGNQGFPTEPTLRPLLQIQPAGRFLTHGRYSQRLLANHVRTLENIYHANGFPKVSITPTVLDDYAGARE